MDKNGCEEKSRAYDYLERVREMGETVRFG
jgi:hypothetical protein